MTTSERKMLQILSDNNGCRAAAIGAAAYGGRRKPQCYARPAFNALCRLAKMGYATRNSPGRWGTFWSITISGRRALGGVAAIKSTGGQ